MLAAKILLMANKGAFYKQLQVPYRPKKRALIHDLWDFKGVFNSWLMELLKGFSFIINGAFKGLLIHD